MKQTIDFNIKKGLKRFCEQSKIGTHHCCIGTPYGWSCDFCLYDELAWLNENGVKTINSCCGHGESSLSFILVEGECSANFMREHDYERVYRTEAEKRFSKLGITEWIPKTNFLYLKKGDKT